jgi:hypothetical protein
MRSKLGIEEFDGVVVAIRDTRLNAGGLYRRLWLADE